MFIEIKGIRRSFGEGESRVEVLKGIDLGIEKGEFCVLLGPSGSGKTTLLNILGVLGVPFQALGLLYRPFADRWGRKTFLIINTFGMSFAMLVIFLSNNIVLYFIV